MPGNLDTDVCESIADAAKHRAAFDAALARLPDAIAARDWDGVERIREEMKVGVDGYVDGLAAAAKRVEHERGI